MALLDLAATADVRLSPAPVGQGRSSARHAPSRAAQPDPGQPSLAGVLRRLGTNLLVACVVPAVVFYSLFVAFGIWPAILSALAWSYGATAYRALTRRRASGLLLLTAAVLSVRTVIALLSHSTFVYFIQPVLTDALIGTAFLLSVFTARPVVARLAGDFYPLTDEQRARPALQRLFRRLTLLWALALLAKAAAMFALLQTQPLGTFLLAKSISIPLTNATCIVVTVLAATATARREGLLPRRTAILPAWALRTSRATS
ncbi:MAG TPA: VC0807 family protein [Nocardioides sp.]|uniref:VC0807 family protein n=1 Tax=Nocardioides sp. TaxID=35761 RepID=UPI002E3743C1|nr:VC0807 family protein [Nocardioides sp.]HEX5090740.1 VC0807 family protein [Nocardioides sp.]